MQKMAEALRVASELRADNVTLHVRSKTEMTRWDALNLASLQRALGSLAQAAEKGHTTLSVENLPPPCFTSHEDDIVEVLKSWPAHLVGACIDTGHAHLGGRLLELAHRLTPRTFVTHLHDNCAQTRDQHLLPGQGTAPWRQFAETLKGEGFQGHRVMEVLKVDTLGKTLRLLKEAIVTTGLSELACADLEA